MQARRLLPLLVPALLTALQGAQAARPDGGRLDPAWFGPGVEFQTGKEIEFRWEAPALDLRGRTIRLARWEPALWLGPARQDRDRALLHQVEDDLGRLLERGLGKGLGGAAGLSRTEGGLLLSGRVVDAQSSGEDYMVQRFSTVTLDLKLTDAATGALLGAYHHTVAATSDGDLPTFFEAWCRQLGKHLKGPGGAPSATAKASPPAPAAQPPAQAAPPPAAPKPAAAKPPAPLPAPFDLEATLQKLETMRQDGLLTEEEYRALKAKAEAKARTK